MQRVEKGMGKCKEEERGRKYRWENSRKGKKERRGKKDVGEEKCAEETRGLDTKGKRVDEKIRKRGKEGSR